VKNNKARLLKYKRRQLIRRILAVLRLMDKVNKVEAWHKVKIYGRHVRISRFLFAKAEYVNLTFVNTGEKDDKN